MNTSFERTATGKEEWLTPPSLIKALGGFDLDPCAPKLSKRPWTTAKEHYDIWDNGLLCPWHGRVWLNPPYGNETHKWLGRLEQHTKGGGSGIALIFARTETEMFKRYIWESKEASCIVFLYGRLRFYNADGTQAANSAGAPSCLVGYGSQEASLLQELTGTTTPRISGKYLHLNN